MRRMLEIYALNAEEAAYLEGFRSWPISLANNSEVSGSVGSLGLLQRLITERVAAPEEVWKITALGVLFGDVLVNISERRLRWRWSMIILGARLRCNGAIPTLLFIPYLRCKVGWRRGRWWMFMRLQRTMPIRLD